jgi:GGDEF domain-containing protein
MPLPDGGFFSTYVDNTEHRRAEKAVAYLAHHDALTGLPNRALLNDRLSVALAQANRGHPLALLLLDLDRFKHCQ